MNWKSSIAEDNMRSLTEGHTEDFVEPFPRKNANKTIIFTRNAAALVITLFLTPPLLLLALRGYLKSKRELGL